MFLAKLPNFERLFDRGAPALFLTLGLFVAGALLAIGA